MSEHDEHNPGAWGKSHPPTPPHPTAPARCGAVIEPNDMPYECRMPAGHAGEHCDGPVSWSEPTAPARGDVCPDCGHAWDEHEVRANPTVNARCMNDENGNREQWFCDCRRMPPTPTDAGEAVDGERLDTAECSAYPNAGRCTHIVCLLRERNAANARLGTVTTALLAAREDRDSAREEAARLGRDVDVAVTSSKNWEAAYDEARSTLAARDAELAGVREREWRLRAAGGQLANCAYNLAQRTTLDESARRSLDSCRRQWDAILKRHTVEANHASDAARSGAGQEG